MFDSSYGQLKAYQKKWGQQDSNGNIQPTAKFPLKLRPCTRSDINFDNDSESKAIFYPPADAYVTDIERFYKKLVCIDENFEVKGNFNQASGTTLMLAFEVCRDAKEIPVAQRKCKDYETQIKPWLRRKFLFTLEN